MLSGRIHLSSPRPQVQGRRGGEGLSAARLAFLAVAAEKHGYTQVAVASEFPHVESKDRKVLRVLFLGRGA